MSYITPPTFPSAQMAPPPPPAAPRRTASTRSTTATQRRPLESAQRILSTQVFEKKHAVEYAHLHNADRDTLRKEAERLEEERKLGRAKRQAFQELSLNTTLPPSRARSVDGTSSTGPRPLSLLQSKEDGGIGLGIRGIRRASGSSRPSSITYRSSGSHAGLVSSQPAERPKSASADPHALEVLVEAITPSTSLDKMAPAEKSRSRHSFDSVHTTATRHRSSYLAQRSSSGENSFAQHSTYSWATSFSGETTELRQAARYIPSSPAADVSDPPPALDTPAREQERRKRIVAIAHTARLLEGVGSRHTEEGEYLDILHGQFGTGAPVFRPRPASSPTKGLQSYVSSLSSRSVRDSYASSLHDLVLQQQGSRLMKEKAWLRESAGAGGGTPWGGDFEPPSDFFTSVPLRTHESDSEENSPPFEFDDHGVGAVKGLRRVNDRHVARPRMPPAQRSHHAELSLNDEESQAGPSTWFNRQPSASAWWDSSAPVGDHSLAHAEETAQQDFCGGEGVEVDTTTSAATLMWTQSRTHNALEPAIDPTIVATTSSISHTTAPTITTHSTTRTSSTPPPLTHSQPTRISRPISSLSTRDPVGMQGITRNSTADVSFSPSDQAFFDTISQIPLRRRSTLTSSMPSRNLLKRRASVTNRHCTTTHTTFSRPRSRSMIVTRDFQRGQSRPPVDGQEKQTLLPPLEPSAQRPPQAATTPVPASDSLFSSPYPASMVSTPSSPPLHHLATPKSPEQDGQGQGAKLMLHDGLHLPPLPPLPHEEDSLTGSARSWLPLGYRRKKKRSRGSLIPMTETPSTTTPRRTRTRRMTTGQSPAHPVAGQVPDQVVLPLPEGGYTPFPFPPRTPHGRASSIAETSPMTTMTMTTTTPPSTWTPRTPDTPQTLHEMMHPVEWSISAPPPLPLPALRPIPSHVPSQTHPTLGPSPLPRGRPEHQSPQEEQQAEWQGQVRSAPSVNIATIASPPPRPPRRPTRVPSRSISPPRNSGRSSFRRASLDSACLPSATTLWDRDSRRVVREQKPEVALPLPMQSLEARPLEAGYPADTSRPLAPSESVARSMVASRVRGAGTGVIVPQLLSPPIPQSPEPKKSKAPTILFWMGFILPLFWIFGSFVGSRSKDNTRQDVEHATHGQLATDATTKKEYPWYRSWAYHPDVYVEACRWASVTTLTACIIAAIVVGIVVAV